MEPPKSDGPKLSDMVNKDTSKVLRPCVGRTQAQTEQRERARADSHLASHSTAILLKILRGPIPSAGTDVKLPSMCGDHPSFTKTELSKEVRDEKKTSYARVSPSTSRSGPCGGGEMRARASEHTLRLVERRHVRALDATDPPAANRALFQAALGSFRWPPYLLCVWVVVLVLTHVLHTLVTMLERALPNVRKFSQYLKQWTEEAWKLESEVNHRVYPVTLALATGLLYAVYCALYAVHAVCVWAIEPLCADVDDKPSCVDVAEPKITNYIDEPLSKTNLKH